MKKYDNRAAVMIASKIEENRLKTYVEALSNLRERIKESKTEFHQIS